MVANQKLRKILDIGIALSMEKNPEKLFCDILDSAMELSECDAGSLYILEDNKLYFKVMKTISKGVNLVGDALENFKPIELKEENVCAYAAIHKKSLNIADVYESDLFDFSGPKNYDQTNNYRTKSMVAIPMINHRNEVIGVMQLINATNGEFSKEDELIISSLASQTAICLSNMTYIEEIDRQMWSFTEALTEVIDMRTPYNANHTKQVAKYVGMIAKHINKLHDKGEEELFFTDEHISELVMAAFLHDIGKIITPTKVMNKQTRLEGYLDDILNRFEKKKLVSEIQMLKGEITSKQYEELSNALDEATELAKEVDKAGFLTDEMEARIDAFSDFFTEDELVCMKIKRGTLTNEERKIMEDHVSVTEKILDKVYFNNAYKNAPVWAANHHECVNGTGYPRGLKGDELSVEARILAVADVCDALLATDRPYKKPLPKEKAFDILRSMANEGKLELKYVEYLEACI